MCCALPVDCFICSIVSDWANVKSSFAVIVALILLAAGTENVHAQAFSVGANFTGTSYLQSGWSPPDTMGSTGPNHIIEMINGTYAVYSKTGTLLDNRISLDEFWTRAGVTGVSGPDNSSFDPRVIFDHSSRRWFAAASQKPTTASNILLAVSNSSDPTAGWRGFRIDADTANTRWADFPTLGVDDDGVYIAANMFGVSGSTSTDVSIFSFPKADLLLDNPTIDNRTEFRIVGQGRGWSIQPSVDFGPSNGRAELLARHFNPINQHQLSHNDILNPSGAGATLLFRGDFTTPPLNQTTTPFARQPGPADDIETGDARISGNVIQTHIAGRANPSLWAVQNVGVNGRAAIRWYEIDSATKNFLQDGVISHPSFDLYYPSIAVNNNGDVVIGFSGSDDHIFISTFAAVGTTFGGTTTFDDFTLLKAGAAPYQVLHEVKDTNGNIVGYRNRWGDYSATTLDPADPGIFWTFQEYAAAPANNWAVQITEIIPIALGERRWSDTAGGFYDDGDNYFTPPTIRDNHVVFSRPETSYTVWFSGTNEINRASVRQGDVTWDLDLFGALFELSSSETDSPSLAIAEFQGTASLTIYGGTLNTVHTKIGSGSGGTGAIVVAAGADWTNTASLNIGAFGSGTVSIFDGASLTSGSALCGGVLGTGNFLVGGAESSATINNNLYIGYGGTGTLTIEDGAHVDSGSALVGGVSGFGSASVSGVSSSWNVNTDLAIGDAGTGILTIAAGAMVSNGAANLGTFGDGTVIVSGTGSRWINNGFLSVGMEFGTGVLSIEDGGVVSSDNATIGRLSGANGTVDVTGSTSAWSNSGEMRLGESGSGALIVGGGGNVANDGMTIVGFVAGSNGELTVQGLGSVWDNARNVFIGLLGTGTMTVSDGGTAHNDWSSLGTGSSGIGRVTVTGAQSEWTNDGYLEVGQSGQGSVEILNGGRVTSGYGFIGATSTGSGMVTVSGNGSTWMNAGNLTIGGQGTGNLTIGPGAAVSVAADLTLFSQGELTLDGGTLAASSINLQDGGVFEWVSGKLHAGTYGSDLVNSAGILAPGQSIGSSTILGNYTQESVAELEIEIGGSDSGQFDTVHVVGTANLAGFLTIPLIGGFAPSIGEQFTVLTAGSIFNEGLSLTGSAAGIFDLLFTTSSVVLQVISAVIPGDFNLDGIVDAADYVVWRKTGGTTQKYNEWRANFGATLGSASLGAPTASRLPVPEPAAILLAVIGSIAAVLVRRRTTALQARSRCHSNPIGVCKRPL